MFNQNEKNKAEMSTQKPDIKPKVHRGAWPFVTFMQLEHEGRILTWHARHHRKGLEHEDHVLERHMIPFWQTKYFNWAIGVLFALGSLLFFTGSMLTTFAAKLNLNPLQIAPIFFLGSLPFTTAAYMQHFQSANATQLGVIPEAEDPYPAVKWIGWDPMSPGWLSTLTQFIGTLAFNLNTYRSMHPPTNWLEQDFLIWLPDMTGSVLFLVSGYMALLEAGHNFWSWRPKDPAWRIAFINIVGCIFFMIAALGAYVSPDMPLGWYADAANVGTGLGALGFFIGGVLLAQESLQKRRRVLMISKSSS